MRQTIAFSDLMIENFQRGQGNTFLRDFLIERTPPGYYLWGMQRDPSSRMTYYLYVTVNPTGLYWTDG